MLNHDIGENAAANVPTGRELEISGRDRGDEIVKNPVRDRFMKSALVAKGPKIELQTLEFNAPLISNAVDGHRCEIWLPGEWTEAGKFRNLKMNQVIALRRRIGEGFERFTRFR
jgi:hypothetical protein